MKSSPASTIIRSQPILFYLYLTISLFAIPPGQIKARFLNDE